MRQDAQIGYPYKMDFVSFVHYRHRAEGDSALRSSLQRLGRALDRTPDMVKLAEKDEPALSPFPISTLVRFADAHRDYVSWKEAAKVLRRNLAKNGLSLPDGSREFAHTTEELGALERTAALCPRSGFPDQNAWAASVEAHVMLYRAGISLCIAEGKATAELVDEGHPDAGEFGDRVARNISLEDIRGYNWLTLRRGERLGALAVNLEFPIDGMRGLAGARLGQLGLMAEKRGVDETVDELLLRDLDATVRGILDQRAEGEAVDSARRAYIGLLETPPLQAEKVVAVYVGREDQPAGVALLDRKGEIVEHVEVASGEDLVAVVRDYVDRHAPEAAVLTVSSDDVARLAGVEQSLGELPVQRVHDAAIGEARQALSCGRFAGNAVVLGRRALKPAREWGRVDPVSLGLGEFPREIDPERLRSVLTEAKVLSSWMRRMSNSPRRGGGRGRNASTLSSGKRLNAFLKTIRDLKAEMTVDGIVTNLTRFGAFVNIGLPTEGMIHISQLSEEFVDDPSQVLRVGQEVSARVLEVLPEKDRIALSLKAPLQRGARDATTREGRPGGPTRNGPPKNRTAALADLDALFKK